MLAREHFPEQIFEQAGRVVEAVLGRTGGLDEAGAFVEEDNAIRGAVQTAPVVARVSRIGEAQNFS